MLTRSVSESIDRISRRDFGDADLIRVLKEAQNGPLRGSSTPSALEVDG